ncbi:MAG TPA: hypothetical protein VNX46_16815 [Candidatus Acidoferrum sp.]|nr:hypothetical protein [Candidatus Acidoferrum sp.]
MKSRFNLLLVLLVLTEMARTESAFATLLTFDHLSTGAVPGLDHTVVPNGYGGLSWDNFGALDGLAAGHSYGYYTGVVSPNNVAFNMYGDSASISVSSGSFDLESAYLTSALNSVPIQQIQVQGFVGGTVVYNNICTVNNYGPTLINFDYVGIQSVTFTSGSQQFAMDNLAVSVPEPDTLGFWTVCAAGIALKFGLRRPRLSSCLRRN